MPSEYSRYSFLLLALVACFSCSEEEDFTAGPASQAGEVTAYFSSDYEQIYVYGEAPTIEDTISIAIIRQGSVGAWTLPIEIERADTAVHVPSSVTFEAGQDTAWLCITSPNVAFTQTSDFVLNIPSQYADVYGEKEGTTHLESAVLWSEWNVVADTVLFYSGIFPTTGCKIENLRGQNRFRFTDFLGSGNTLEFSIKCDGDFDSKNMKNNSGEINPLTNYWADENGWYYTNGGNYDPWQISDNTGNATQVNWIRFWPDRSYTYIDFRLKANKTKTITFGDRKFENDYDNHYSLMTGWVYYTDAKGNEKSAWDYIYMLTGYLKE